MRRLAVPIAAVSALAMAAPANADPGTYGKNDAGGFRNVLPPGQNGLDTLGQILAFRNSGALPQHWADQQPLYDGLIYAAPTLTDDQVADYYKDATFGVKKSNRAKTVKPRKGVTILRDKQYGVPRVYGKTRSDTMFGAGYASANDRLFLMDVLRHTGRADLSSFLGGANLNADANQWQTSAYTEDDLKRMLKAPAQGSQKEWNKLRQDVDAYVDGINAYIKDTKKDSSLLPGEYVALGAKLKTWKVTDVMSVASLFGGIFGRGGGGEVLSAQILRALEARFGTEQGRAVWSSFRSKNNPTAPTTIPQSFPYQTGDSFAAKGLALPDTGTTVTPAQVIYGQSGTASLQSADDKVSIGDALQQEQLDGHHSNWELLSAKNSANGRPLGVLGPQVGYYLPQVLMELELHGPGIDARGASFPGVSMYVQLGRGRDYAWSATSAGSDNIDTFAEVLCGGSKFKYKYKGKCLPMEKLVRKVSWKPNPADPTPAGSATLKAYRTVHGLVTHYGTVNGKQVAYVTARTTYLHEADSIVGFRRFNQPEKMKNPKAFHESASKIQFTFNWAYQNAKDTAYYLSGAYPKRAKGTSPDFPVLGTGKYDWQGFDAKNYTSDLLAFKKHPKTKNQPVMVSWNNKPAKDWAASDRQWGYGPFYRSNLIEEKLQAAVSGGQKATLAQVVKAMEESATQDIRAAKLLTTVFEAMGTPSDPDVAVAVDKIKAWMADGGHRRDLDKDGAYEHTEAIQILDAWWPKLMTAQFGPGLGDSALTEIQKMIAFGANTTRPSAPGFADGWWGYSLQDLKRVLTGAPVEGGFPVAFCGNGDLTACSTALQDSLKSALSVTAAELYGSGACTSDPQPSCWNANRARVTAGVTKPNVYPFQNRPTFQQAVSVEK
ncbi:MAG: penicillin acylase family protein [Candidatus Nanopelagicales bacterium]|nr:penicillin acylase family protein [Candidatus Nanopelagicales bacterium]